MFEVSALSSGSSGNCFYVGNSDTGKGILVDAGISAGRTVERMMMINRSIKDIKGIFITHEHIDHIKGADVLSRKYGIPVYATKKTFNDRFITTEEWQRTIKNDENVDVEGMMIQAFSKNHEAADPISFIIEHSKNGKKIGVITDVGKTCKNIQGSIEESAMLFLESNHDQQMLIDGRYPWFLKKWIMSDTGHLSNTQSALAVLEHSTPRLKKVVLSHLSVNNNTPEEAMKTYHDLLRERRDINPEVTVSTKMMSTPIMRVF